MIGLSVGIEEISARTSARMRYDEQSGSHQIETVVFLSGKIGARRTELLINGRKSIAGLPVELKIVAGPPFPLAEHEPELHQTQPRDNLHREAVRQRVGELVFVEAYEDGELGIRQPDTVWGELVVPEVMFSDLWQLIRAGGAKINGAALSVFGSRMRRSDEPFGALTYCWAVEALPSRSPLYIAEFSYWAGDRP